MSAPVDVLAVKPVVIDWMRAIADKDAAYQRANALDHAINGVGLLFAERDAAVAELIEALRVAVRQNSHDMLMTGEELRQCEHALAAIGSMP